MQPGLALYVGMEIEVVSSKGHRRGLCIAQCTHMFTAISVYREEGVASIQGLVCEQSGASADCMDGKRGSGV